MIALDMEFTEFGIDAGGALLVHLSPLQGVLTPDLAEAIIADDPTASGIIGQMTVLAPRGDLNQDGFLDLVVSAPHRDEIALNAGKTFVLYGETTGF